MTKFPEIDQYTYVRTKVHVIDRSKTTISVTDEYFFRRIEYSNIIAIHEKST